MDEERQQDDSTADEPKCAICGKPLAGEEWFDDEDWGDAHTRCLGWA